MSRAHLSVISGLSLSGKLYQMTLEHSFKGKDVAAFLAHLLRQIPGKLLIVWDGCPIHRSKEVKALLSSEAGKRLWLECLPAYAPDLNPDEGIWSYLKCHMLRNCCFPDLKALKRGLRKAIKSLRLKKQVLAGCVKQPGYV